MHNHFYYAYHSSLAKNTVLQQTSTVMSGNSVCGLEQGVRSVPGVELTTLDENAVIIHILGFFPHVTPTLHRTDFEFNIDDICSHYDSNELHAAVS